MKHFEADEKSKYHKGFDPGDPPQCESDEGEAYVEESNDPSNHANPLFIVHYPDGSTFSTMQKQVAEREATKYNDL